MTTPPKWAINQERLQTHGKRVLGTRRSNEWVSSENVDAVPRARVPAENRKEVRRTTPLEVLEAIEGLISAAATTSSHATPPPMPPTPNDHNVTLQSLDSVDTSDPDPDATAPPHMNAAQASASFSPSVIAGIRRFLGL